MLTISEFLDSTNKEFKKKIKIGIAQIFKRFKFLDTALKQSRGIGYSSSIETEIKHLIGSHKDDFILFDVGANIGSYSIMTAKLFPKSTIYSFEPSKATFHQLVQNVKSDISIFPFRIGFGEEKKKTLLYSDQLESGMASTYKRQFANSNIKFSHTETIEIVKLDDWVKRYKVTPDFIKIDVEGGELSVLKGAINALNRVKAVQFEFGGTAIDARIYFRDYWNFFTELNFKLYRYTPNGLLEIETYSEKEEIFEFMNYLAVPIKEFAP